MDDTGKKHEIDISFLEQVVANFIPEEHEPPATIGHPQSNAPAYGWACALRIEGDRLQSQFCEVDPAFEQLVREGKFKKRSAAFYMDTRTAPGGRVPALRHVGFLGAQPPAVKGLREIHFNEGEAVTFADINFSEGESMDEEKVKTTVQESIKEFFKNLFGGSKDDGAQASFSESDVKRMVTEAVTAATTPLTEANKTLATQVETLAQQVSTHSGVSTRSEIVAFCESLGKAKFPPAFKAMGVIEFMEKLATVPDDVKVSVISFEEKDGTKKEIKTESTLLSYFKEFLKGIGPIIQFGEQFGTLSGSGEIPTDPDDLKKLRVGAGIKGEGGQK